MKAILSERGRMIFKLAIVIFEGLFVTVCVAIFLNISFGWFSENQSTSADHLSVALQYDRQFGEYTAYAYDPESDGISVSDLSEPISIQKYDTIFVSRNRLTPVVIRAKLYGEDVPRNGTVALTVWRDETAAENPEDPGMLSNVISSVLRFTFCKGKDFYDDDPDVLYQNVYAEQYEAAIVCSDNTSTSAVFPRQADGGYRKAESLRFSVPYTEEDWNDDELNVYLFITYDAGLIGAYQSQVRADEFGELGNKITLENDLSRLQAEFEAEN